MNPTDQDRRKKLVIGAWGVAIVLLAGAAFAMFQWRAHVRAQGERLIEKRRAVEEHMALAKKEQDEIIEKIKEYRSKTQNETGRRPTDEEGLIPGYKKQIRELYEQISSDKESLRQIERDLSRLAGK